MVRYPWYAATLMDDCPSWLTWLRYTAFIPLYPIGVIAEMVLLYVSARLTAAQRCAQWGFHRPSRQVFDCVTAM
jgi:very-long-chain (3R)-3-hydroxyacyl-CoA dehydratase